MDMGWKVSIVPFYMDFLIADEEGEFTRVVVRLSPHDAARYAVRWARMDRESGCLISYEDLISSWDRHTREILDLWGLSRLQIIKAIDRQL